MELRLQNDENGELARVDLCAASTDFQRSADLYVYHGAEYNRVEVLLDTDERPDVQGVPQAKYIELGSSMPSGTAAQPTDHEAKEAQEFEEVHGAREIRPQEAATVNIGNQDAEEPPNASVPRYGRISVKGSDTMVILGQRWAEAFMKENAGPQIQVSGGGSGTGISALINGTTDICQSAREMKQAEKDQLKAKYKTEGVEIPVAKDCVTIYVHSSNPINELSVEQLKGIYTRKLTNWKDLGGPDKTIIPYSRESSSGTYVFFREHVLADADFAPHVQTLPGTAAVVNAVSKEEYAIGYGSAAYARSIKLVKIKKDASAAAVAPDKENVQSGAYPIARPLFLYLRNRGDGDIDAFVDWILSPEGQSLAETVGYVPIR